MFKKKLTRNLSVVCWFLLTLFSTVACGPSSSGPSVVATQSVLQRAEAALPASGFEDVRGLRTWVWGIE